MERTAHPGNYYRCGYSVIVAGMAGSIPARLWKPKGLKARGTVCGDNWRGSAAV